MSDKKEKLTVTLGNEEIEALYKILDAYFWDVDLDPEKEEEFRTVEWLYNDLLEAMKRIDPDRFKTPDWDDFTDLMAFRRKILAHKPLFRRG